MNRRLVLHILAAATLAACTGDGPTAVANDAVSVVREGDALRITNKTDVARAYAIFDPNWLALADLSLQAFCNTWEESCLRLPAHGSLLVPLSEVGGYSTATTSVTVYTWRVVMSEVNGQLEVVSDDAILLKL
jgi:hypothetical protein